MLHGCTLHKTQKKLKNFSSYLRKIFMTLLYSFIKMIVSALVMFLLVLPSAIEKKR